MSKYLDAIRHAERARRFAESETGQLQARLDGMGIEYVQGWHDEDTGEYVAERGSTSIDVDGIEFTFGDNLDGTLEVVAYMTVEQAADLAELLCKGECDYGRCAATISDAARRENAHVTR